MPPSHEQVMSPAVRKLVELLARVAWEQLQAEQAAALPQLPLPADRQAA